MATIDLTDYTDDEGFVLHFGGNPREVNTYTFANALLAFSDAYRELNDQIYHGEAIELRLEALGPGSFRAKVKGLRKGLKNLLGSATTHVLIPVLVMFLYDNYVDPDEINVTTTDDQVIIERGADRIIVSRKIYELSRSLPRPERLRQKFGKAVEAVEDDDNVQSIGVVRAPDDDTPIIDIPREEFSRIRELSEVQQLTSTERVKLEGATLSIIKAVFSDQRRKWDFVWNGVKISAFIDDETFVADLMRRKYTVGNGDAIDCILEIDQKWDEMARVWLNVSYSVGTVNRYIPAPDNPDLFEHEDNDSAL